VSSCLLGEQVRYNGGHSRSRFLTDELGPHADWVPTCPEMAIGLGTPMETVRLTLEMQGNPRPPHQRAASCIQPGQQGTRPGQRHDLLARIEAYRCGQAPLSMPVALLAHHASGGTLPWLAAQTR
jgi:hypothetical protein